ncbi:ribosomal protein S5 domain 2-type protein [Echria macrotheca]|uniref:Small ribosomal subunit protein uS9m n=1 Tax=Echria macrotheca TaxID=438768 RepID=A0AAJ0FGF7_9PEZI|nr:ribosomal protein S5 domain 2-type protein [Echria macrotheca]
MASSKQSFTTALRSIRRTANGQWQPLERQFEALRVGGSVPRSRRCLSTSPRSRDDVESFPIRAAAEIDFAPRPLERLPIARPVPASPSYFSRKPTFQDGFLRLEELMREYGKLPTIPTEQAERIAWKSFRNFKHALGEEIKESEFHRCMALVKRLHRIHPDMKPEEVTSALEAYKKDIQPFTRTDTKPIIDRLGRSLGTGRRKASTARAWVVEGTGEVLVNGKTLAEFFGRVHDRESAVWSLQATERLDKYNVWALVEGGGTTGQAEALTLAIAKAVLAHEPALKPALRKAGCITRDPRRVERKKHGHVKARKSPTWVKR